MNPNLKNKRLLASWEMYGVFQPRDEQDPKQQLITICENQFKIEEITRKKNEEYYRGEMKNTILNDRYEKNEAHGYGQDVYEHDIWEGSFQRGMLNGYGRHIDEGGMCEIGYFKNDKLHGDGEVL